MSDGDIERPGADPPTVEPPSDASVPVLPQSTPATPHPMMRYADDDLVDDDPWATETPALTGEQLATRNVPAAPRSAGTTMPSVGHDATPLPEVEPMGPATGALLVGRMLLAAAALLIGLAARRSTGAGGEERASAFWSVAGSAGVLTLVGVVGLAFWSTTLAANARRLRARTASPQAMAWSWAIPVVWVAVSSLTYLRFEVDAEVDPLPAVAGLGWIISITIPYARLQGICRGLSRTPPIVWITAYPIDLVAIGLVWWRLTSWPSPVADRSDHVELTANVAFGAAAALALNVVVFAWLASRTSSGVYERLGRFEALHRPDAGAEPEWYQTGIAARRALAPPVAARPLIATPRLSTAVAALHVLWGAAVFVFGILLAALAFDLDSDDVFDGGDLAIDDVDVDLVVAVGTATGLLYGAAVVAHGIWATLTAINARRVTVHSPNPGTFVLAFAPAPMLMVSGVVVGGRLGYALVALGLTIGFVAVIIVNQMLVALSGRVGRPIRGFSRWTVCLTLTYAAGVAINLMFSWSVPQLGVYATLSLAQGLLVALGGSIGYSAMHALDVELRDHRQVHRVEG